MAEGETKTFCQDNDLISIEAQVSLILSMISEVESTKNTTQEVLAVINSMLGEIKREGRLTQKTLQGASREQVGAAFGTFM